MKNYMNVIEQNLHYYEERLCATNPRVETHLWFFYESRMFNWLNLWRCQRKFFGEED